MGLHVSISSSMDQAVDRARELDCTTFQIFTRNPRGWAFRELKVEEVTAFLNKMKQYGYRTAVAHMPYLPNLSSPIKETYEKSLDTLKVELVRCGMLSIPYLVVHLGSHMGSGADKGRARVVEACSEVLKFTKNDVMLLLENTAGTKNSIGSSFKELKLILNKIKPREKVGVCFDTCHAFAAGYDLRDETSVRHTLGELDEVIGTAEVKVIHVNDSKGELGCNSDRHEHIGMGCIGDEGFKAILRDDRVRERLLILETPSDDRRSDKENLDKVRRLSRI